MDQAIKKKKIALYTTLQVIGILALTIIGSCWDWMNFGWTFSKIATWKYWEGVIQQMAMYSIALALGLLTTMEKEELTNEEYGSRLSVYRELIKCKKQSFTTYIEFTLNPFIKKTAMKEKYSRKLYRLDKHSRDEWKLSWRECKDMSDEEFRLYKPITRRRFINFFGRIFKGLEYQEKTKYSGWCKRYCAKRRRLEKLASDEYINENYEYSSVRYERVNPNVFTWSVRLGDSKQSQYQVENKAAVDIIASMLRKMLTVALTAIFIGCIVYDASASELLEQVNGWVSVLIKYVIRVIFIFVNYGMGVLTGKRVFYNNFTWVLINRIRILKEYINWKKSNNEEDSYADQVIDSYYKNLELKKQLEEAVKAAEQKQLK